jgi:hypothetical protein
MKMTNFSSFLVVGLILFGCRMNSKKLEDGASLTKNKITAKDETIKQINDQYLISGSKVGLFSIGNSWQQISREVYQFEFVQGYGNCHDACCDGGFNLGREIINSEYGMEVSPLILTIGAMEFDQNESENIHIDNPEVFYSSSPNCSGWFWKDKIAYVIIHSDLFKTKDGIGVGTSLLHLEKEFGKLQFDIGWIEEDANSIKVKIEKYPNLAFVLDVEDFNGDWEVISFSGFDNSVSTSDFKPETKVKRIFVNPIVD